MGIVTEFGAAFWSISLETGVWIVLGLLLGGLVEAAVPRSWFERQLGGRGLRPIVKASLLGLPLPLCSCAVIPAAAQLRRSGASRGATAAFTVSTPQTGEESIPVTWALFGPAFAVLRPVAAIVTALITGVLVDRFGERPSKTISLGVADADPSCGDSCGCSAETGGEDDAGAPRPRFSVGRVVRHGFGTLMSSIAPWLALGLVLAAGASALIPDGWISANVGGGPVPMLVMLAASVPLYICATSSTPLAHALVIGGLSPGAALVLLLAGPATNIATVTWLWKELGSRSTVIYLGSIAVVALGAGIVVDALAPTLRIVEDASAAGGHEHAGVWSMIGAGAMLALIAGHLAAAVWRRAARSPEPSCCGSD